MNAVHEAWKKRNSINTVLATITLRDDDLYALTLIYPSGQRIVRYYNTHEVALHEGARHSAYIVSHDA